jgi:secreted PhoX family phosphatase
MTSENSIYSIEVVGRNKAVVGKLVSPSTQKNAGFSPTTATLNSPDNLAQDALGNIYIVEDAPNGSDVGGDIWFARDANNDGVAESLDHFMSIRVDGSEATGMIFNPAKPTEFAVAVQHPDSTDLAVVPNGLGDAVWQFDISTIANQEFVRALEKAHRKISKK